MVDDDWSFCRRALVQHSRTFALPIALLPDVLERGVTTAYLLCRIADTVEDTPRWQPWDKELLFRRFLDVLSERSPAEAFVTARSALPPLEDAEGELLDELGRVVRVFRSVPAHAAATPWIAELVRGMALYSQRLAGRDGVQALDSVPDLERYCYFVAGTVGKMLTELFSGHLGLGAESQRRLHDDAEAFGKGLQLVNILRDMSGDLQRGVCYIPRSELAKQGLEPRDLVRPECVLQARSALEPLFEMARRSLDDGFRYVLSLPAEAAEVRSFCLVPLWLAVATLRRCEQDPALFHTGHRVKLSRTEVAGLIRDCSLRVADDGALQSAFSRLQTHGLVAAN